MKKIALLIALISAIGVTSAQGAPAPKAKPPHPPQASTGPATAIGPTAAKLTGSVNPRGLKTTYHFDYGRSVSYGHSTAVLSAGSGTTAKSVSARISGLVPGTTYDFRLVASSSAGKTLGKNSHFTTLPRLTIGARPRPIIFGAATTVRGQLQSQNNDGKGIELQANPFPYKGFVTVATTTTDGLGRYAFPGLRPRVNTRYRTRTTQGPSLASATVKVGVRIRLSRKASDSTPAIGQRVRFSGFACPAHTGDRVSLQRHGKTGWATVKRTHLIQTTSSAACANRSRYKLSIRVRRNGRFRTVAAADQNHLRGFSRGIRIRVH